MIYYTTVQKECQTKQFLNHRDKRSEIQQKNEKTTKEKIE